MRVHHVRGRTCFQKFELLAKVELAKFLTIANSENAEILWSLISEFNLTNSEIIITEPKHIRKSS
jgi:hypothetical protein